MVSTAKLRLLSALSNGDVEEFAPSIAEDTGDIRYQEAERLLGEGDGTPYETLEDLAELGILSREFQGKEYVCPDCTATKMRFMTGCGACGSLHTVETEMDVHVDCDHADDPAAFRSDRGSAEGSCPKCGAIVVLATDLERQPRHVCQDCGTMTADPEHGLRCLACEAVYGASDVEERVLHRYRFDEGGEAWLHTQLAARETLASSLAERGFDVSVDADVNADGETHVVDVYGTEELLGDRVVGTVHDRPDAIAVETLVTAAGAADARPVLVTTSGALDANVATIVDTEEIRVLRPDGDRLVPSYDVLGERDASSVFQRLTSSVTERLQ